MNYLVSAICGLLLLCSAVPGIAAQYGVARSSTPVLNTPDLTGVFGGRDGTTLKSDRCGQVRELEFIALPGTLFKILELQHRNGTEVYRVETDEYPIPSGTRLYVDSRFIALRDGQPPARQRRQPNREQVVRFMKAAVGSPYVWGGNIRQGVAELFNMFYRDGAAVENKERLTLAGLDCSGLLYEATDGWTPRNTSGLVSFGRGIQVAGKKASALAGMLEPLDLIVWNGHVIIVLDKETVIESRLECGKAGNGGVVTTPLKQRLVDIMRKRRPVDIWPATGKQRNVFVVRRWLAP